MQAYSSQKAQLIYSHFELKLNVIAVFYAYKNIYNYLNNCQLYCTNNVAYLIINHLNTHKFCFTLE